MASIWARVGAEAMDGGGEGWSGEQSPAVREEETGDDNTDGGEETDVVGEGTEEGDDADDVGEGAEDGGDETVSWAVAAEAQAVAPLRTWGVQAAAVCGGVAVSHTRPSLTPTPTAPGCAHRSSTPAVQSRGTLITLAGSCVVLLLPLSSKQLPSPSQSLADGASPN